MVHRCQSGGFQRRAVFSLFLLGALNLLTDPTHGQGSGVESLAESVVFLEQNGVVAVEAEHFRRQNTKGPRHWQLTTVATQPSIKSDPDPSHATGASGGAYLEILPDTRITHAEKLIVGENFQPEPGEIGKLDYQVHFENPGRYYVWVRCFSTGSEDNGIHVGLDGAWPDHGKRMQWCQGKNSWRWESRQRTKKEHCGEAHEIYLDIDKPGLHTISFCMREDGFEFDRWLLTQDKNFQRPDDAGPETKVFAGELPKGFQTIQKPDTDSEEETKPEISEKQSARQPDGTGKITVTGKLKKWHDIRLTLDGPFASESDNDPNPFLDYRMTATFRHASGIPSYKVPGYFAADGNAAESSASTGTQWRCHFSPDKVGTWNYSIEFVTDKQVAINPDQPGNKLAPFNGAAGQFQVGPASEGTSDFRSLGRLQYVGSHYLNLAETNQPFIKAGPDAPETLLAFTDFDGTEAKKLKKGPLKTWQPHVQDWQSGDPIWKSGKGKGLIGALNYLSKKGLNTFSCLTYNVGGDGHNVWPHVSDQDRLHFDCSKLDQWGIVFDHAQAKGLMIHVKLQETENDDQIANQKGEKKAIPAALDGGDLGVERKLYLRELVARFAHAPGLEWNLGEENTQTPVQQKAMINYLQQIDPYQHPIVVHTYPKQQNKVYRKLLGDNSRLTGASLQNMWNDTHKRTLQWVQESASSGRPWVVANDEQGPAGQGVPPDRGYDGSEGMGSMKGGTQYSPDDIRKQTLWGNLMAGGAGVNYYFGYKLKQNDLICEDFRSRDKSWEYCGLALDFFRDQNLPLTKMKNMNSLVGNPENKYGPWCLAAVDEIYIVYSPIGNVVTLDVPWKKANCEVSVFNPRTGTGPDPKLALCKDTEDGVEMSQLDSQPMQDWVFIVRPVEKSNGSD